jgi:hypothetical protein
LKRKPKDPVKYFEVWYIVDWRKHRRRFSIIRRAKLGTRRRNVALNKYPCTFANLWPTAVRKTCRKIECIKVLL